jgi:hypothetical protein
LFGPFPQHPITISCSFGRLLIQFLTEGVLSPKLSNAVTDGMIRTDTFFRHYTTLLEVVVGLEALG